MKYYISDTHFFHANAIRFDSRPFSSVEEMNGKMAQLWNEKVGSDDIVYFLGDFSFGKNPETIELLESLNGHKVLIAGNHDGRLLKDRRFVSRWDEIFDYLEVSDEADRKPIRICLCHYPIIPFKSRMREGNFMFFGHIHNSTADEPLTRRYIEEARKVELETFGDRVVYSQIRGVKAERKAYNVGCMMLYMGYAPQTAADVICGGEAYYDSRLKDNSGE